MVSISHKKIANLLSFRAKKKLIHPLFSLYSLLSLVVCSESLTYIEYYRYKTPLPESGRF